MRRYTLRERLGATLGLFPPAIYDVFPSPLFGRVLLLASKVGVFEALHSNPRSTTEVAREIGASPIGTELVLASLHGAGYIRRLRDDRYTLTRQSKKWLVRSSPDYIGNFLAYVDLLHSHWQYLEQTVRDGKPPRTYVETFGGKEWEIYVHGMMDLARLLMPHLFRHLRIPRKAEAIMDIGGSHGLYSIELCRKHPRVRATIADLPPAFELTREIVRTHNLNDRISLLPCDITKHPFPTDQYDVVLAFNIVHGFDDVTNHRLVGSFTSMLRRGGVLYILDQLRDDARSGVGRFLPLMVGVNLLNEIGGNVYRFEEVHRWCRNAGLRSITRRRLQIPGVSLVKAEKDA